MMNLPKLRGAKFLEDQSIRSAKYELTSELKKMPNFSVLLLLNWCQQHCQIKSKTRYISFFFFVMVGFFGVCLWVNVIFDHLFVGKWGFLQRDAEFHNTMPFSSRTTIPSTSCTTYRDAGFLICKMVCCLFCFYQDYKSVIWKDESFHFFVCGEWERALQQLNYMSSISKALLLHCIHLIANYISLQPPFLAIWSLPKKLFD